VRELREYILKFRKGNAWFDLIANERRPETEGILVADRVFDEYVLFIRKNLLLF
jgi:hypothetical protein